MGPPGTRVILGLLASGHDVPEILKLHPDLSRNDVARAVGEGLAALEGTLGGRVETRAERIARLRVKHPRAFEPWNAQEDAALVEEFRAGATVAALGRAFGRPAGAIRMRLQKLGEEPRRGRVHEEGSK